MAIEEDIRRLADEARPALRSITQLLNAATATLASIRGERRWTAADLARRTGLTAGGVHKRLRKAGIYTGHGHTYTPEDVMHVFPEITGVE